MPPKQYSPATGDPFSDTTQPRTANVSSTAWEFSGEFVTSVGKVNVSSSIRRIRGGLGSA